MRFFPRVLLAAAMFTAASLGAQAPDTARKVTQAGTRLIDSAAVKIFGDSLVQVHDSVAPPGAPTWDIDVRSYESRERVTHFVSIFSGRAKERVTDWLERGSRYEPMIRSKLRAGGIPEDMYYLALIESGFDPHAYSRAAAVGMWQFMASTARGMGLRVDWWVDERRDPVRSTGAAVRFIRDLRDQFGSLYLAAAAYNGGPNRVARGMTRYAEDVNTEVEDPFFMLAEKDYLKRETKDYVPQLIAAALIAKEPARYGLSLRTLPPFSYDSVLVPGSTPLAAVAKAAGTPLGSLLELNPHFLRGMTPPREASLVRIPTGTAPAFDSTFVTLPKDDRLATRTVTTKKGDSPDRIASANDITTAAVRAFNPKARVLKSGRYAIGQPLTVPLPQVAAAVRFVPDPSIERFGSKKKSRSAKKASTTKKSSAAKSKSASAKKGGTVKKKSPAAPKRSGGLKTSSKKKKK